MTDFLNTVINTDIGGQWASYPARIEGAVYEASVTNEQYISQYVTIPRFQATDGPEVADPLGNVVTNSEAVFRYSFTAGTLTRISMQLASSIINGDAIAGL